MSQSSRKPIVDPRQAERRRSILIRVGAVVVLIAVAVAVGLWAVMSNESDTGSGSQVSVATDTGAFRVTKAPAGTQPKAVLTVIEDFQCPACRQFEESFGATVAELRENPQVAVDYHPIAILDRSSSTQYSTRSANASACVAESTAGGGDFGVWQKFHDLLYQRQPEEGGAGLPDSELNSIAKEAGASNVNSCITDGQFKDWVTQQTQDVTQTGVNSTPTVRLNGQDLQLTTPEDLKARVEQALAG